MDGPPTKTSATAPQECASLPRDPRHPSPRFSRDTKGTHQTAEHHSLSRPRTLSGEEADIFIPGAFLDDSKRSRSLGRAPIRAVKSDSNLGNPSDSSSALIEDELPNSDNASGSGLATTIALPRPDEDEDLSLEAQNPIPPSSPATDQPHLQPELKQGDTAVRAPHRTKEPDLAFAQGPTTHGGSSIIQGLEEAAIEVYHEAEHMLHDVGETVSAYFGGGKKASDETTRDRDSQIKPSAASGADAPRAPTAEGGSVQIPAHQVIAESMRGRKVSGNQTALPHTIQREYFRSKEYDLDGDRMDVSESLFDDDASDQGMDYDLGDASEAARRTLGGEPGVGYGGVEYHLKGHGGILPGFPTPEGMVKLLSERMEDDRLRAAGAENPTTSPPLSTSSDSGEHENIVRGRSQIIKGEPSVSVQTVRGPYGDLVSEGSPAEISPDSRIVGEKRALPVFVSGEQAAAGKYEAIFEPVADEPKELRAQQVGETPAFKGGSSPTTDTLEGRLGGPITKEQNILEGEKARHAASKN